MNTEAWAIVGVVVGAILGGGAQILADWIRRRGERTILTRAERREAYSEFLAASTQAIGGFAHAKTLFVPDGAAMGRERRIALSESTRATQNRMAVATSRVELVAPEDTRTAAIRVFTAAMAFMFKDEEGMVDRLVDAQLEFQRLAKRDLA